MFLVTKPADEQIRAFLDAQQELSFSYAETGATESGLPAGYTVDHNRVYLGRGAETFERAKAAIRGWKMFEVGWIRLCWPEAPVETGSTVAVLAGVMGIWSLNGCRIVYTIDEEGEAARFGFAYGTLPGHVERGEERFCVEWQKADDSVWYDILAFSRPNRLVAWLGYPFVRGLQRRFGRDSKAAMVRAVVK